MAFHTGLHGLNSKVQGQTKSDNNLLIVKLWQLLSYITYTCFYLPRQKSEIYWFHIHHNVAVHFELCMITQKRFHKFHSNLAHTCIWVRRGTLC